MKQNATTEMLLAAMMAATPERKKDALLVLRGEASVADGGRGAGAGARRGLEPFVGIREVAEFLNVSARSVKRWRVPGHKLGGRCCFVSVTPTASSSYCRISRYWWPERNRYHGRDENELD